MLKNEGEFILVSPRAHDIGTLIRGLSRPVRNVREVAEAAAVAKPGDIVMILAACYPSEPYLVTEEQWEALAPCRVYIEYPGFLPGLGTGTRRDATPLERAWVCTSKRQPDALAAISTPSLMLYPVEQAFIKIGKLAGYDTLAFETGETPVDPLLFELPGRAVLVAATPLSDFVTARFAPTEIWQTVWEEILQWLTGDPSLALPTPEPVTRATYKESTPLPSDAQRRAVRRSIQWFHDARMLLSASHETAYLAVEDDGFIDRGAMPGGDGSGGVLEGYISEINRGGLQPTRCWRRADCVAEVAGAFALSGLLEEPGERQGVAARLNDWLYFHSNMTSGVRADAQHPAYGLIGWHDRARYGRFNLRDGWDIYYGDDNARVILGSIAAAGALKTDRWLPHMIRCILSNLRTAGPHGLRKNAIWNDGLESEGWQSFSCDETPSPHWISPHYQCYLHACYLWLYRHTGDELLLRAAERGLSLLMETYPTRWRWTNGLQQERARMLLPLAWLVRVRPTAQHRDWLATVARDLLEAQMPCGALREVMAPGNGKYGPPQRHEDYGSQEASLLQADGDPVADLLYTCNFAFLGLHEAAEATGETGYSDAADRLAAFLIRIQTTSTRKEYSGLWFRAFDFRRWEAWASDADGSWGAWCVETGWTQAWITSVLAMREQKTSLWEIYRPAELDSLYQREKEDLLGSLNPALNIIR